ncbi:hypothetical protein ACIHFE_31680 [Streptomyces sp. NPDC052396]|uniref:hypothetical protein n=1 Tax=Streptomyces sp. NPDC052396 TaxID=3365689 RepID=UPI0037D32666
MIAVEVPPSGIHHTGGWPAPWFRGQGPDAELFAGAALGAAGLVPADGPAKHPLMNGRVVRRAAKRAAAPAGVPGAAALLAYCYCY